ncbi:hypothetical protein Q5752_001631 [Cryptotrichosporon argae]
MGVSPLGAGTWSTSQLAFADNPAVLGWPAAPPASLSVAYGAHSPYFATALRGLPYPTHGSHCRKRALFGLVDELRLELDGDGRLVDSRTAHRWLALTSPTARGRGPGPLFPAVTRLVLGRGVLSALADWAERHGQQLPAFEQPAHALVPALKRSCSPARLCVNLAPHVDSDAYVHTRLPAHGSARELGPVAYGLLISGALVELARKWTAPVRHVDVYCAYVSHQVPRAVIPQSPKASATPPAPAPERPRPRPPAPAHTFRFPSGRGSDQPEPAAIASLIARQSTARVPSLASVNAEHRGEPDSAEVREVAAVVRALIRVAMAGSEAGTAGAASADDEEEEVEEVGVHSENDWSDADDAA